MEDCGTPPALTGTNNITSKVKFDGTNTAQVQQGQTLNVFIANVATTVTSLTAAIAAVVKTPLDIDTTGITSTIVSPTGLTLAEWLTNLSTFLADLGTEVSALEASDIAYTADYSPLGMTDPTTVEEGLDGLLDYVASFEATILNPAIYAVQMPLYPFSSEDLGITDNGDGTVTIDEISLWSARGYITMPEEIVTLENDKSNYIIAPWTNVLPRNTQIKYGALYHWYAVDNAAGISTGVDGWAVPTNVELQALSTYLGGDVVSGGKLKEMGLAHWLTPNTGATNDVNFNARGAGYREDEGTAYDLLQVQAAYWSSDQVDAGAAYILLIIYASTYAGLAQTGKKGGYSVRLIRPATAPEQLLADGTYLTPYTGNDGKTYRVVKIGTQAWLAENLCETKYADGTSIPNITDNALWAADTTGAYCSYDNDITNAYTTIYSQNYSVRSTTIGDPAPSDTGIFMAKVDVVAAVIGTPTRILETHPIKGSLVKGKTLDITHINIPNSFDGGFATDGDGKVTLNPTKSIELSSDQPQLVNDVASPGNTKYYGSNAVGAKSWYSFPYFPTSSANFFQFTNGAGLFTEVKDAYADAKYDGTGAFTFGNRSGAIGENSFVQGNAYATMKGERSFGIDDYSQNGDVQVSCETTDNTTTNMTIDGDNLALREGFNRLRLEVIAFDFDNTIGAMFDDLIFPVINDGGTLTFSKATPSTQSANVTYSDLEVTFAVKIVADVFYIAVTGIAATNIRWTCKVSNLELNNNPIVS